MPIIEPQLKAALAVHSNPGVYALLLGSGVSRAAGVPTGWEIVEDLIRRLAAAEGRSEIEDPAAWYRQATGEDPDYSKLLEVVGGTASERRQLLHGYFEPTEEEREQGLKVPTAAHRAIAKLVSSGFIKVILTTNFDRLLEQALAEMNITPVVVSTTDAVKGAPPVTHSRCTIVKLHGDYLDSRIRNTPAELAAYDPVMDAYLDRIFDDFGLIISGWSADWDCALRSALERRPSRRYSTFWVHRGSPGSVARKLIAQLGAELMVTASADSFFSHLAEKVQSLSEYDKPHPLSTAAAISAVKRYLVDPRHRIQLADLVRGETDSAIRSLLDKGLMIVPSSLSVEELNARLKEYEASVERLAHVLATGVLWDEGQYRTLWLDSLSRIANLPKPESGRIDLLGLRRYPCLLIVYACGIAALFQQRYKTLAGILVGVSIRIDAKKEPLVAVVNADSVFDYDIGRRLLGLDRRKTPVSDYIYGVIRDWLVGSTIDADSYDQLFDELEYLIGLAYADHLSPEEKLSGPWIPNGRYTWRDRSFLSEFRTQLQREGASSWFITSGLFGSADAVYKAMDLVNAALGRIPLR